MAAKEEDHLPDEELISQTRFVTNLHHAPLQPRLNVATIFVSSALIFAASDTTSSAMSRILHVLATHPTEQARLRKEVREARHDHGDLDYEALMGLPYLDAVVKETLRL